MQKAIYINGLWVEPRSGETRRVVNPATSETISEVGYGGRDEALAAAAAAAAAFEPWRQKTVYERAALLRRLADAIRSRQEDLAHILTMEVGKPLAEASAEVGASADQFEWYSEEIKRSAGDVIPPRLGNRRHMTIRHPVGPVAAITPWNFPVMLAARKMAPAMAAGCPVVVRPASQPPLTLIEIFRLLETIGFDDGVANLVVGNPGECSQVFVEDERIKKISFTGSLAVGRELYTACAGRMKKITLELGGHSPFIILPDVPLDEAVECAVFAKYRNMGQVCISASRFYVPQAVKAAFEERVVTAVSKLKIGDGRDPDTDIGPLFEEKRVQATKQLINDLVAKGGKVLYGGSPPEGEAYAKGNFFMPTVVTDVTNDMKIMQEEPFAPIMPIIAYESVDDAIAMANDTPYGLAAYALTRDLRYTVKLAEELEAGIIGINDCAPSAAQCPFGGMKQSGVGREGWSQGLEAYFETKYISIGI